MEELDITVRKGFLLRPFPVLGSEGRLEQIINTKSTTETWHLTNSPQKRWISINIVQILIFFICHYLHEQGFVYVQSIEQIQPANINTTEQSWVKPANTFLKGCIHILSMLPFAHAIKFCRSRDSSSTYIYIKIVCQVFEKYIILYMHPWVSDLGGLLCLTITEQTENKLTNNNKKGKHEIFFGLS